MTTTRNLILEYLDEHQTATAPELSRALHLTPANIRYHLSNLREAGAIAAVDDLNVNKKGRPSKIYRRSTPEADPYIMLAQNLLKILRANPAGAPWQTAAESLSSQPEQNGRRHTIQRLNATIESLNAYGHQANWIASRGGPAVELHGCPFIEIIDEHPELCEIDREVINNCTGMRFELTEKLKADKKKRVVCRFKRKDRL